MQQGLATAAACLLLGLQAFQALAQAPVSDGAEGAEVCSALNPQACTAMDDLAMLQVVHRGRGSGKLQSGRKRAVAACHMGNSSCPLADMTEGQATLVYPGGATGCITGGAYAFSVLKGSSDKLAVMFQGGGACWEANGAFGKQVVIMCTTELGDSAEWLSVGVGIQKPSDPSNPFHGYTIVQSLYCSGDAHMGNTTMTDGQATYTQSGYENTMAMRKWLVDNFPGELSSLVLTGYSAGSLGTMAWAADFLGGFSYKSATVLMDSYAGSFPVGTQAPTIKRWGGCDLPLWTGELQTKCADGTITIQAVLEDAMKKFPDVAFGSIQSKTDGYQVAFYEGMAKSWGMIDQMSCPGSKLYQDCNKIFEGFTAFPNYAVYLIDGPQHCFINYDLLYSASVEGPSTLAGSGAPSLRDWVSQLVNHSPCSSQCTSEGAGEVPADERQCDQQLLSHSVNLVK